MEEAGEDLPRLVQKPVWHFEWPAFWASTVYRFGGFVEICWDLGTGALQC